MGYVNIARFRLMDSLVSQIGFAETDMASLHQELECSCHHAMVLVQNTVVATSVSTVDVDVAFGCGGQKRFHGFSKRGHGIGGKNVLPA